MITDEIMEALDMLITMCKDKNQAQGMISVQEMLGDFDEHKFITSTEEEKSNWVLEYLPPRT